MIMSDLQKGASAQGRSVVTVTSLVTTCASCGHIFKPGEKLDLCPECGGRKVKMIEDPENTVQIRCAS